MAPREPGTDQPPPPSRVELIFNSIGFYFSGMVGAFMYGMGDKMKRGDISFVDYSSAALGFPDQSWPGYIVLIVLGWFVVFIYTPKTRVDAFTRGFGAYALLNLSLYSPPPSLDALENKNVRQEPVITIPSHPHPEELNLDSPKDDASLSFFSIAYAMKGVANSEKKGISNIEEPVRFEVFIYGKPAKEQSDFSQQDVQIQQENPVYLDGVDLIIRDESTKKIIGQGKVPGYSVIQAPPGKYILDVEAPDYERSRTIITVDEKTKEFNIFLTKDNSPLFIKRIFPRKIIKPYQGNVKRNKPSTPIKSK